MYIRVVNLKFSSKIDSDAMQALAKYEMINNLPGIISIETFQVNELHSIGILKFDSKESAEKSKVVYIDNMKNPNIRVEIFEGERLFIVEKS